MTGLDRAAIWVLCLEVAWFVLVGAGARLCHSVETAEWSVYPLPIQDWRFGRQTGIGCGWEITTRIDTFNFGCFGVRRFTPWD